ncbi:hypothetical protein GQ42DRAFT_162194 [Ramicandelaber brevisporus]|nr:hypothetical protein GQ42DRAFT_162194 [Ramicandelaber brevisporus]
MLPIATASTVLRQSTSRVSASAATAAAASALAMSWRYATHRGIKIPTIEVKLGNMLNLNGRRVTVTHKETPSGGRRVSFIRLEVKDNLTGARKEERFSMDSYVDWIKVLHQDLQVLYTAGDVIHLMDPKTFEELELTVGAVEKVCGSMNSSTGGGSSAAGRPMAPWMTDGMKLTVYRDEEMVDQDPDKALLSVRLPSTHKYKVKSIKPRVERSSGGNTVSAELENGQAVEIPSHVNIGDEIVVNLNTFTYSGRAN